MTTKSEQTDIAERLARLESGVQTILTTLESFSEVPKAVAVLQSEVKNLERRLSDDVKGLERRQSEDAASTAAITAVHSAQIYKMWWLLGAAGGAGAAGGHALTRIIGS